METWIAYKNGRVVEQVLCEDGEPPRWSTDAKGAKRILAPRPGDLAAEIFDQKTGDWKANPVHAGFLADFDAGPEHKAKAHLQKVMEAKLLQVGIAVEGLLSKESQLIGLSVEELAASVLAHNAEFEEAEISRRKTKKGV
jgi:hypothetical protein